MRNNLDKQNIISFQSDVINLFTDVNPTKIAILPTTEYEGIFKNGGVGTYYKGLAKRLHSEGWYVILMFCDMESDFAGESDIKEIENIFTPNQRSNVLNLSPSHQLILEQVKDDWVNSFGYRCLFFIQAILNHFSSAQVYVEFHEMLGIGYYSLQAKQSKILGDNCIIAVTMHSSHEWIYEANEKYEIEYPEWLWRISHYEQFSFENADLGFFPSHYLTTRVNTYGWNTKNGHNMPNYIPQVKQTLNMNKNDLVQYKFDDSTRREEMTQALKKTYYKSLDEEKLKSQEIKKDIDDHVFLRYNNTLCHYVPWVIKHFNLQGKDMLEIGCGTGSSTAAFAHFCNHIYAYEIIEKDVEASRERMRIMDIDNVEITQVTPENSLSIIKTNHSDGVDVILLFAVLEHMKINERLEVLSETWKLLKPNGILIITETPNRLTYYDHHTSWLNFFHMLPEDLAIQYYQKSPREHLKFSLDEAIAKKGISEGIERLIRWGNGVSFHEFEIALNADLNDLIIADGDDSLIRELYPVTLQEELLKDYFLKQKINQPLAFTNSVLNFIMQKLT